MMESLSGPDLSVILTTDSDLHVLTRVMGYLRWQTGAGGEMLGYVFGAGQAAARLAKFEFHREAWLNKKEKAHLSKNGFSF
jgi:hypothetical protein